MTFPRWTRAAVWTALAVGTSLAAPLLRGRSLEAPLHTALVFTPASFDFGSIRAGTPIKVEFAFTNGGGTPIRISDVHGSCGCVKAETSSSYVEPGGAGKISATISTVGRQGPQTFLIQLKTDEGPLGGATLRVKGEIRMALRPNPRYILFGAVKPGSEQHAEIRVEKLEPVEGITVSCRGDGLSAEKVKEDEKALTLKVTVKVPWARAMRGSGVTVTAAEGSLWIAVAWQIPPPFELSAKEVEIKGRKGEIVAKPAWPEVKLADVKVRGLPIDVQRDGDRITFTLKDSPFGVPSGAMVELVPEPMALGSMRVPLVVRPE